MDELVKREKLKEWFVKNDLEIIDHAQGDPDTNMHELIVQSVFTKKNTLDERVIKVINVDYRNRTMTIKLWWSQFEFYCL